MRRRDFISLVGGAAAWPLRAHAQQPGKLPVIGFITGVSPDTYPDRLNAFRKGLQDGGHIEGRNVLIEYRWAEGHYDRLPRLAAELVDRKVAVIAAVGGPTIALAARAATTTIPIVFQIGVDPVELGLVASLARPGGNITGITSMNVELGAKRVEIMHTLAPAATDIALLVNPTSSRKCRERRARGASGGEQNRSSTSGLTGKRRRRFQKCVCKNTGSEGRRAVVGNRCLVQQQTVYRSFNSQFDAHDQRLS